jgi:hypothetical protein
MHGEGQNASREMPELGRLKAATERVAVAANRVDSFLVRFNGTLPEVSPPTAPPVPDNYRNDLDSLFYAVERMEMLVSQLDNIG